MATLFERIAGTDPDAPKVPIHVFIALVHEFYEGRATGQQVKVVLGLNDADMVDAQFMKQCIDAAPNKQAFLRALKDHFYLAEWKGSKPHFSDEQAFYTKLQDIVTAQGGTPPERN